MFPPLTESVAARNFQRARSSRDKLPDTNIGESNRKRYSYFEFTNLFISDLLLGEITRTYMQEVRRDTIFVHFVNNYSQVVCDDFCQKTPHFSSFTLITLYDD